MYSLPLPPPCRPGERGSSGKQSSRSKDTKRGGCCAVQRGVSGNHCGYCCSHLTVLLLFGAITDDAIGYAVLCMP